MLFRSYLALPRRWGLTQRSAAVGGGHAGYKVYPCKDGRVAIAALEPHFAAALGAQAGVAKPNIMTMFAPATHAAVAAWALGLTCEELEQVALAHDLPLLTMRR